MKGWGVSIVGIVLGSIVALWIRVLLDIKKVSAETGVITDEEKLFLKHAHKFLDESAIKPEHRNK